MTREQLAELVTDLGVAVASAAGAPAWAVTAAADLVRAGIQLFSATTDADREDALMTAAEVAKRAADDAKFGAKP